MLVEYLIALGSLVVIAVIVLSLGWIAFKNTLGYRVVLRLSPGLVITYANSYLWGKVGIGNIGFTVLILGIGGLVILACVYWAHRALVAPMIKDANNMGLASEKLNEAVKVISRASNQLAEGSSSQAASLEESSSSLEEMASMTRNNADNAAQADTLMSETRTTMERAVQSMDQLNGSMKDIAAASEETSKIIKTIDEIAFQTNLLALNAAVEAARAGEAGAGFAVVADEVRSLAMRAAEAAQSTAALIEGTVSKVGDGVKLVNSTGEVFEEVAGNSVKVAELISEIAMASREQSQGIDQINGAVTQMDKATQTAAANAQESAAAASDMDVLCGRMDNMVRTVIAGLGGKVHGNGNGHADMDDWTAGSRQSARPVSAAPARLPAVRPAKGVPASRRIEQKSKTEPKPEDVIPFDDEGDFTDF